jgi:hypothetical protein
MRPPGILPRRLITEDGVTEEVRDARHLRGALRLRGVGDACSVCDVVDDRDAPHPRLDRASAFTKPAKQA